MAQSFGLGAHDIACERGGRLLFEKLNFSLGPGEALLISGPNGAGKTSLLRQIAGLLPLASGRLSLRGGETEATLAELCHYVGHLNGIKSAESVAENLSFWRDYLGPEAASPSAALNVFGLRALADLPVGLLSAGQKRKLALSRLFAAARPIWLLDEPSVSLDPASVKLLERAIARHLTRGGIALIASHVGLNVKCKHRLVLGRGGNR